MNEIYIYVSTIHKLPSLQMTTRLYLTSTLYLRNGIRANVTHGEYSSKKI